MAPDFDHFPTEEELRSVLEDETDPASNAYKRTLTYPKIRISSVVLNCLLFLTLVAGLIVLLWFTTKNILLTILVPTGLAVLYLFIRAKSIFIFLVQCYQLLAPTSLRMKCRFEPSCSDYMIAAIRKYGAWKGLFKGLHRLHRCHYPNGGYDYP